MTSQYFGFDDDETVEVLNTNGNLAAGKNMASKPPSPVKIPISEIQALLSQDLTSNDSTKNSTLNESSFYAEEVSSFSIIFVHVDSYSFSITNTYTSFSFHQDTSISQSHLDCTIEESFPMNQVRIFLRLKVSLTIMDSILKIDIPLQSLNSSHTVNGKTRQITRGEKRARKVLGAIENKGSEVNLYFVFCWCDF